MGYLVMQIILWLAGAALLGLAFGWYMGHRGLEEAVEEQRKEKEEAIADWKNRRAEALTLGDVARERIATLEAAIDELRTELLAKSERALLLANHLERSEARISELEDNPGSSFPRPLGPRESGHATAPRTLARLEGRPGSSKTAPDEDAEPAGRTLFDPPARDKRN
jgi:hypothetical protein